MVWKSLSAVGVAIRSVPDTDNYQKFVIWCFGAGMLAHAVTSVSVSYFDQSAIFFWLNVAILGSVLSMTHAERIPHIDENQKDTITKPISGRRVVQSYW
jgi:hypothetical protein